MTVTSSSCPDDYYHCGSGECIVKTSYCDSHTDCWDGTDETNCSKVSQYYFLVLIILSQWFGRIFKNHLLATRVVCTFLHIYAVTVSVLGYLCLVWKRRRLAYQHIRTFEKIVELYTTHYFTGRHVAHLKKL